MPKNPSEIKHWPDPKDYGLPYVEVTPILPTVQEESAKEESNHQSVAEPIEVVEVVASEMEDSKESESNIQAPEAPIIEASQAKTEDVASEPIPSKRVENKPIAREEKKSNSWVVIVLILAVLIVSVIVWQLMSQGNGSQVSETTAANQETINSQPQAAQPAVEKPLTEEMQSSENQDSIPESNSSLEEPVESQQTGTTIDRTGAETLIRVESKSDRPQYFIVVGSLPNEKMAISESAQYFGRASSVYLILPYEDVKNYRLAIGSFSSFRKASEELDLIKDQYTEALWILKY
ncbi:hypothetical protein JYB64_05675 [Algoriphagus aestuarii]|nr:hypothetical protein [Algoriphagus aestuarii]